MSKLLFSGSRTDSVILLSGVISDDTGNVDPTYSDAGVQFGNSGGSFKVPFYDPAAAPMLEPYEVPGGHTLYWHAYIGMDFDRGLAGPCITFYDTAGYPWLQMLWGGQLQYNSGTADTVFWSNIGINSYGQPGSLRRPNPWDIVVNIDTAGNHSVTMGVGGDTVVEMVGFVQPLMTGLAYAVLQPISGPTTATTLSEMLVTQDISAVDGHVFTRRATGPGAHSDWTGAYTDVNEVFTNDGNFNSAAAAGLSQSYPMGNIAVPEGYNIAGAFHWLRGKNGGASPANIQSLIRTSAAVDHDTPNVPGLGPLFNTFGVRYDVNPDTGVAWTEADWNAPVQLGFTSEA